MSGRIGPDLQDRISRVAHEVRNTLFVMTAQLDACDPELEKHAEFRELAASLRRSIARVNELVAGLTEASEKKRE